MKRIHLQLKKKISLDIKSKEGSINNDKDNNLMAQKINLNMIKSSENPQEEENQLKEKEKEIDKKNCTGISLWY